MNWWITTAICWAVYHPAKPSKDRSGKETAVLNERNNANTMRKRYMWCSVAYTGLFLLLISGCGLPDFIELKAPIPYTGTLPSSVVAFTEPPDANINGYALYYKVYTNLNDIDDDLDYFEESSSYYNTKDMPIGETVANRRGFLRAGELGETSINWSILIPSLGAGTTIYIDFDNSFDIQPVVGDGWNSTNEDPITNIMILARGFRDPTIGSIELLKFLDDNNDPNSGWDFDSADLDDYNDGDLRRESNVSDYYNYINNQPGIDLEDIEKCGDALLSLSPYPQIYIGFAVHAKGWDSTSSTIIESKPVFIDYITLQQIFDADRNR